MLISVSWLLDSSTDRTPVLVSRIPSSISGSGVFDSSSSGLFEFAGDTSSLLDLCTYASPTIGDRISVQTFLAMLAIVLGVVTVRPFEVRLVLGVLSCLSD